MRTLFIILFTSLYSLAQLLQAQEVIVFSSPKYLKCDDTCRVYAPVSGTPKATLILLHGYSGSYRNWGDQADLQEVSDRTGFRIITPNGFYNGWYADNADSTKMQVRSFFCKEFFPQIFAKYGLDPSTTFIDGLSMGGHGAVTLFIDNYDLFRAAGSMSGVLDLTHSRLEKQIREVFGDSYETRVISESATTKAQQIAGREKPILISCGYSDPYNICTQEFAAVCKELNIPYIHSESPGKHSWSFWRFALEQHLWYFQRILDNKL